jgi:hypothetical protein
VFLCYTCFMMFGESRGARTGDGTTRALSNDGCGELGAGVWGARRASVLQTGCAGAARQGTTGGGVRVRDGVNGLESRRTRQATYARRVAWALRQDGCTCGARIKLVHGDRLRGRPDTFLRRRRGASRSDITIKLSDTNVTPENVCVERQLDK